MSSKQSCMFSSTAGLFMVGLGLTTVSVIMGLRSKRNACGKREGCRSLAKPEKIKLVYFDIEGVAEPIRLACKLGGIALEDVRIKYADWTALKPRTRYGQLPYAVIDGEEHYQSGALLHYIGRVAALYPEDPIAALKVDEVLGVADDISKALAPSLAINRLKDVTDEQKKDIVSEMRQVARDTRLPEILAALEHLLSDNPSGYCVGNSVTIADLAVVVRIRWLTKGILDGIPKEIVDGFPHIKQHRERVEALPALQGWYTQ